MAAIPARVPGVSYLFPSPTITFEAALRDVASGSAKARVSAAYALGDVSEPVEKRRALEALIRALDDERGDVRGAACAALGELGEASAVPHLIKRLDEGDAGVRQHAAIALGSLAHPDGFEPLATALRSGPPDLRFQAATSIAEVDPERAFDLVIDALDDRDPQVIGAAALSVGAIAATNDNKRPRAVSALSARLASSDPGTRFDVAYALAELGEAAGRTALADSIDDPERAWDAVTALAQIAASDELARAVASKKAPAEARVLAAGKLLALRDDDPARKVLVEHLKSRKFNVRGLAIEQLAEIGGAWAIAPLEKLSTSSKGVELRGPIDTALRQIRGRA